MLLERMLHDFDTLDTNKIMHAGQNGVIDNENNSVRILMNKIKHSLLL